jgi:hypothetical protein
MLPHRPSLRHFRATSHANRPTQPLRRLHTTAFGQCGAHNPPHTPQSQTLACSRSNIPAHLRSLPSGVCGAIPLTKHTGYPTNSCCRPENPTEALQVTTTLHWHNSCPTRSVPCESPTLGLSDTTCPKQTGWIVEGVCRLHRYLPCHPPLPPNDGLSRPQSLPGRPFPALPPLRPGPFPYLASPQQYTSCVCHSVIFLSANAQHFSDSHAS